MEGFKKYPSIENSYREKELNHWLTRYPQLQMETYLITEKIHGSNMSWKITKEGVQFGKRTAPLAEDESFYGYQGAMKKYSKEIHIFQSYLEEKNLGSILIFGEFFGSNIQKGIKYGSEKRFKVFDIYIDNVLLSQYDTLELLRILFIEDLFVPVVATVEGLADALNYDIRFNSKLFNTEEENIAEGIVIKPYKKTYMNEESPFYLKKKNKEFTEIEHEPKVYVVDEELEAVRDVFRAYLNENRVDSIMSKEGSIESVKDIGKYIKFVMEDAKEDFLKDNMDLFMTLEDKQKKQVFGIAGSVIVPILNTYL